MKHDRSQKPMQLNLGYVVILIAKYLSQLNKVFYIKHSTYINIFLNSWLPKSYLLDVWFCIKGKKLVFTIAYMYN